GDVSSGREIAGEGVAITLRQVGVGVADIEREHLVGKTDTNVPGVVVGVINAIRERPRKAGIGKGRSVERIGGSKPLPAELAGDVHADAAAAEHGAGRGVLAGDRSVVAPSARVQEARGIVFGEAELPVIVDGVIDLCVGLEEAQVLLDHVAVDQGVGRAFVAEGYTRRIECGAVVAGSAGIQVAPKTEVESKSAEGRTNTAVDVDLSRCTVRERNA